MEGHKLVSIVYNLIDYFPKKEVYGLASQMQRAAVSITSNIAEGFSRQTEKDKSRFNTMALGLLTELQNQLLVAKDLKYISYEVFITTANQTVKVHKLINGLIKYLQNQNT